MNRKEALIQMAQQRGVDTVIAKAALEDADTDAIRTLLNQIEQAPDSQYIFTKYVEEGLRAAMERDKVLEVADILLEKRSNALASIARVLSTYTDLKAVSLLRQIATLSWASYASRTAAASALIRAAHQGDYELAMHDPIEEVRILAVKQLERVHSTSALIDALSDDSQDVRRIAAWYMGRNKIYEALEDLLKMAVVEQDIEALRAAIWSLGVLRVKTVREQLEPFVRHENALIRATAQDALGKLA